MKTDKNESDTESWTIEVAKDKVQTSVKFIFKGILSIAFGIGFLAFQSTGIMFLHGGQNHKVAVIIVSVVFISIIAGLILIVLGSTNIVQDYNARRFIMKNRLYSFKLVFTKKQIISDGLDDLLNDKNKK